jgi:hypothetical protein
MRSPFSKSGTIQVANGPGREIGAIMASVMEALQRQKALDLRSTSDSITFRGGLFRGVTDWNVLRPISSGQIVFAHTEDTVTMTYRVSWFGLFIITTATVSVAVAFSGDRQVAFILPLAWLFLLFIAYTRVALGFREFLARAAGVPPTNHTSIGDPFSDY